MRLTRADRSVLSDWWFTVDRLMFFALLLLMGAGLVLSLAASPPIAAKYDLEPFYFVRRHAALLLPAVAIMFAASTLTPKQIRRASLVIFLVGIALMVLILVLGPEIKGAKRWLQLGAVSISSPVREAVFTCSRLVSREPETPRHSRASAAVAFTPSERLLPSCSPISADDPVTLVWGASVDMAGGNMVGSARSAPRRRRSSGLFLVPTSPRASTASSNPDSGDTYQADRSLIFPACGGSAGARARTGKNVLPTPHSFIFAVTARSTA